MYVCVNQKIFKYSQSERKELLVQSGNVVWLLADNRLSVRLLFLLFCKLFFVVAFAVSLSLLLLVALTRYGNYSVGLVDISPPAKQHVNTHTCLEIYNLCLHTHTEANISYMYIYIYMLWVNVCIKRMNWLFAVATFDWNKLRIHTYTCKNKQTYINTYTQAYKQLRFPIAYVIIHSYTLNRVYYVWYDIF